MRVPSTKLMMLGVGVLVALIAIPAVAWALTSPRTTVDWPADGSQAHGRVTVAGSASHRVGVAGVRLVIRDLDNGEYWNGSSWQEPFVRFDVPVFDQGASDTRWNYTIPADVLTPGHYRARAFAYSVEGNGDGFGGDLNEFEYTGEFDRSLYDTEIVSPVIGSVAAGPIRVSGNASSSEGIESVDVVVRNTNTNLYWNAEENEWQENFTTSQAELSDPDGATETDWTVEIPADASESGSYFARAWVLTKEGNGDPIGRGQTNFQVVIADGDTEPEVVEEVAAAPLSLIHI